MTLTNWIIQQRMGHVLDRGRALVLFGLSKLAQPCSTAGSWLHRLKSCGQHWYLGA